MNSALTPTERVISIIDPNGALGFIAELVDNSIDGYMNASDSWKKNNSGKKRIEIHLPTKKELIDNSGSIIVRDYGPGMNSKQLVDSLRAGFSDAEGYDRLGLFGLGFNIATARLGKKTRVSTARGDDDHFYWIDLDPVRMKKERLANPENQFFADDGTSPKKCRQTLIRNKK